MPHPLNDSNVTNTTKAGSYAFDANTTLPFALPAWEGTAGALGVSINEKGARSVFYLGTDGELYQVTEDGSDDTGVWKMAPRPDADAWPKADTPGGPLGVASHYGRKQVRVHYVSGGRMIEARGEGALWSPAAALPNYNSSAQNPDAPATSASASASAAAGPSLATGAKVGIGVGVSLGALALGGMFGALLFLRRRKRRHDATAAAAKSPPPSHSYPAYAPQPQDPFSSYAPAAEPYGQAYPPPPPAAWGYSPLGPEKRPGELDGPQLYEMSEQRGRHELMGEGHIQEAP